MDFAVYSPNRLFRMPFSHKPGKANYLLNGRCGEQPQTLSFQRSLITVCPETKLTCFLACGKREEGPSGRGCSCPDECIDEIRGFFATAHPTHRLIFSKEGNRGSIYCSPGIHCPFIGRAHTHNNTYIHVNLVTGHYRYQCLDPTCRARSERGFFRCGNVHTYFGQKHGPISIPKWAC